MKLDGVCVDAVQSVAAFVLFFDLFFPPCKKFD